MKVTFDQHIGVFEGAFLKEWCEEIINYFNSKTIISRHQVEKGIKSTLKNDHLLSDYSNPQHVEFYKFFSEHFWKNIYPLYNQKYTFDIDITPYTKFISDFKIQKTNITEGYHAWHYEAAPGIGINRCMAWTLYLNDVEEGGETEFLHQSLRISPKQGTLCLWPAGYTHIHRGNPPLTGTKYIVTGWIEVPPSSKPNQLNE